jgi:peptidoglycan/xylan/chitin deacetylase (PgdA/CDA1 family)
MCVVGRGTGVSVKGSIRFLLVVAGLLGALLLPAVAAAGPTIVSLTFDDGSADQYAARSMLARNSLHGTFYINSNNVGASSFMTWNDLSDLAADGNEIGGHTLDHADLTTVTTDEATRQVCDDRQALSSRGFSVTDFAYPFGASNSSVESIVQACGYQSARRAWGLCRVGLMPPNCNDVLSEPIPPRNIWAIAAAGVNAAHTLSDAQGAITRAEDAGGGWVVLMFHHVCDGCSPQNGASVSPAILSAFVDWLAPRASNGTYVRTMADVIGDRTPPTSSIACNGGSCAGWRNQPVSVTLSGTDTGTAVREIRYTTNGSTPTTSSPLYSGPFTVSTTTAVNYRAWDMAGNVETTKSQLIQVDANPPLSSIACNDAACSSSTYTAPVSVSLSATDSTGSGVAEIHYETNGSDPTLLSPRYFTPFTVSTTTTVKFRAWDNAGNVEATNSQLIQVDTTPGDATPPTSTIACNGSACAGTYTAPVSVSLSATDSQSSVAAIRYTTDGSDPTSSSTLYTAPFTVSTTTTVKFRAWDNVGNVEATKSQVIQIDTTPVDTTPPTSTIVCNGAACSSGWYGAAVTVSLSATDSGGAVAAIRYTTNGSDPTTSSTLYTTPFTVSTTTTVKFRAWDNAGNVEATKSQLIQIDTSVPTVSITSPANGATVTGNVKIVAAATDAPSGVASVAFYVDGALIGTTANSPWQMPWNTKKVSSGQHVLTAVARDRAGNSATSPAVTVTVR